MFLRKARSVGIGLVVFCLFLPGTESDVMIQNKEPAVAQEMGDSRR